jgi:PKD repeat protein
MTIDAGYYCDCNGFQASIGMNKNFDCFVGNAFQFTANTNRPGGNYTYSWDFGDGTTSTQQNPLHTYTQAGEYDVKLIVTDPTCGCRYEANVHQVYVGPQPKVNYDWQYNGNCLTYDFNSNSTIPTGWITSFFWDFGNGQTSTQSNPLATFPVAGTYNVKLVVTSNLGCKDSIIFPVNIINKCTNPGAGGTTGSTGGGGVSPCPTVGAITGTTSLCVGGTSALADTTAGGTWSSSNTSVATISGTGVVTALSAGSTTISYVVVRPCGTVAVSTTVNVSSNSAQPIQGQDSVCIGSTIYLSNANGGGTYSGTNASASVASNGAIIGIAAGNVTVTYTVTTSCGTFTTTKNILVSGNCNVTSGGGGGIESKTLGDVIAQRLYGNAKNSLVEIDGRTSGVRFKHSGTVVNGIQDLKLTTLVPGSVINTDNAFVSTPTDLVTFTNATEVLAVDYVKNNNIKAVAFGTKTLGDVYSHTKPICDRLKGATLLEVKTVNVKGYSLMAYKVQQCSGEIEYAMNLSAGTETNRSSISLQSNWFTDNYVKEETLFNFQLWAVSEAMVTSMASDIYH